MPTKDCLGCPQTLASWDSVLVPFTIDNGWHITANQSVSEEATSEHRMI